MSNFTSQGMEATCNMGTMSGYAPFTGIMGATTGYMPAAAMRHVHDYRGATEYTGQDSMNHRHLIGASTGGAIPVTQNMHVHRFISGTTDNLGHYHRVIETTGVNVSVPGGGHVHSGAGMTTYSRGHSHEYAFTSRVNRQTNRSGY